MDRQKLMRMTDRSERMYLRERVGGHDQRPKGSQLHKTRGAVAAKVSATSAPQAPRPAPAPSSSPPSPAPSPPRSLSGSPAPWGPEHSSQGRRCFEDRGPKPQNHSGLGGGAGPGGQARLHGIQDRWSGRGAGGRGTGCFRVTDPPVPLPLGRMGWWGAGKHGRPSPDGHIDPSLLASG